MRTISLIALFIFFNNSLAFGNSITFNVDLLGNINANITISEQSSYPVYVFLPFQILSESHLEHSQDVNVKLISSNFNYSILHINSNDGISVNFKIVSAKKLEQNSEGKALFELDQSYQFISTLDSKLLTKTNSISNFTISITLPNEFDEKTITSLGFEKKNDRTYVTKATKSKINWIVFPNPISKSTNTINFILAFFVGCLLLLINIPAFKRRNLIWSTSVLILSAGFLVGLFILTVKIPYYRLLIAGIIPQIIYGLAISLYLIIEKFFAVNIFGVVYVDNFPRQIIDLEIIEIKDGNEISIKKIEQLKEGGNFHFFLKSINRKERTFKIKAFLDITKQYTSPEFNLKPGKKKEEIIRI
jgi:hypothetical protein